MDIMDIQQRVISLITAEITLNEDGTARLPDGFDAVRAELAQLLSAHPELADLDDLIKAMDTQREMLTDPALAGMMVASIDPDRTPEPQIFDAIERGDLDAVRAALQDCDVNATHGEYNATALYRAMSGFEVSLDIITLLLDAGADPRKGLTDSNVLHGLGFARLRDIRPEDLSVIIKRCVAAGADIEQRTDHLKWTPLMSAVSEWNPVATEALLLAGADITARAGDVDGVCFSGADVFSFANGHDETLAVLNCYGAPQ